MRAPLTDLVQFTPVSFAQGHITLNASFSISGARSHGSEMIINRPARSNGAEPTEPSYSFVRPARAPPATLLPSLQKSTQEDDTISVTTRTDDDPVGEAFKLPALDDDDEEVIVYQPRFVAHTLLTPYELTGEFI